MSAFFFILIILAFGCFIVFRRIYNSPEHKGEIGENKVRNILSQLSDEYKVLNDVILITDRGTTQIDHVIVSKYGIFVIETKNYRGDIYGDDNRKEWTQIIVTEVTYIKKWYKTYKYVTKNKFYNPVKQVLGHVYEIKKTLKEWSYLKVVPIVVFTGSANLSNVTTNHHVVYDNYLLNTILGYNTIYLSETDVDNVTNQIAQKKCKGICG